MGCFRNESLLPIVTDAVNASDTDVDFSFYSEIVLELEDAPGMPWFDVLTTSSEEE